MLARNPPLSFPQTAADSWLEVPCAETQGRAVMAKLVHDVVAEAMRLNLYGAPAAEPVTKANGARFPRGGDKVRNG